MVNHDRDFLVLAEQGVAHSGICFCHAQDRTPTQIIEALVIVHQCSSAEEMAGRIQFL